MSSELSAKQTQAALLLARGDTVTTTAEQVGVNRLTIHQWLREDDNFNAYLNSLKRELVDAGRSAMRASIVTAIDTINQLMLSSTNDVVRLNAAKEILDRAGLANDKPIGSDDVLQLQQERNFGFSFQYHVNVLRNKNQNGRRNLTDGWKFQLSQAKKEILLEQGKIAQARKPIDSVMSTIDKTNHNTRDTIANDLGWSTGKVAMDD